MVKEWLANGMLHGHSNLDDEADTIIKELGDHALTKSHSRHISAKKCKEIGLNVEMLEERQDIQETVLAIHFACIHTFQATQALKIIENHNGTAFIQQAQLVLKHG